MMRAERLLSIMLRLQTHKKVTAKQLATDLGVSIRTIYRDMDALGMAGIPIYTQRGENGGCFLDEDYRVSLTNLNLTELQALFVSGGTSPLESLDVHHKIENGLLKILSSLPSHYQTEVKALQQRIYIDTQNWNQPEEDLPLLQKLQSVVWNNQLVHIMYQAMDKEETPRLIAPYGLVVKAHIWYMVAFREDINDFRIYRLSRIKQVTVVEERFERQADFDLQAVWHQKRRDFEDLIRANYMVTMQMPIHLVQALDYFIPDRYQVLNEIGKKVIVQAQFYHINEARPIILGFGNLVDVLQPIDLADSILATAHSIIEKYQ